jgi:hypothetical protein
LTLPQEQEVDYAGIESAGEDMNAEAAYDNALIEDAEIEAEVMGGAGRDGGIG